jgi:hypothetical protein
MSKWTDFINGVESKGNLVDLIEEAQSAVSSLKARSLSEEDRLKKINSLLLEIKLNAKFLESKTLVLENKVSILKEDLNFIED